MPTEQSEQLTAPAAEYLPVMHTAETVLRPSIAQYDPASHGPQEIWLVLAWKLPAKQLVQLAAPAAENIPEIQKGQPLWLVAVWYLPAAQAVQIDATSAEYSPAAQSLQLAAPPNEYCPAAQLLVTADKPEVAQYVPAGQGSHDNAPVSA